MSADKKIYRDQAIAHRAQIDPADPLENADDAARIFFETLDVKPQSAIAVYWPKGDEFNIMPLIDEILKHDHTCLLPVIEKGSKVLRFVQWNEDAGLSAGPFGVMQPEIDPDYLPIVPDIICVPLLAFDRQGHRLGYGGGYYDATIETMREQNPSLVCVGVCYAQQAVLFNLPVEAHDQKLDWIITPQKAHKYDA